MELARTLTHGLFYAYVQMLLALLLGCSIMWHTVYSNAGTLLFPQLLGVAIMLIALAQLGILRSAFSLAIGQLKSALKQD